MSKLRETLITNTEKKFLLKALSEWNRIDGRAFNEFRDLKIEFGKDWGCCLVSLGFTTVLAQVSCEVQTPKTSRPSEGILYVNLELSPIAAPHFEPARQSDLHIQLNRILDKCLKDSKAIDLESLCIKVNEKVWCIRVDVNVLNHEGNILDCASIAALTALAHFRRPDVTCDGEEIIIHTYAQRDSIPTVIHHYPICVTFAIFLNGDVILADPTLLEESIADACLVFGLNAHREMCALHLGGCASMSPNIILKTSIHAADRATKIVQVIRESVEQDTLKRQDGNLVGFENSVYFDEVINLSKDSLEKALDRWITKSKKPKKTPKSENVEPAVIETIGEQTAVLIPPQNENNVWNLVSSDEDDDVNDEKMDDAVVDDKNKVKVLDSDGSEEESVVVLNADKHTNKKRRKR